MTSRPRTFSADSDSTTSDRPSSNAARAQWLTIAQACQILGVDESTMRRWSDAGKVPVFRTPGGHRRYTEDDLRRLVGQGPRLRERPRVSRQELTDRSLSAYEEEYLRGARDRRWFQSYSAATLEEHRRLGRRLVDLAIHYSAATPNASDRASLLGEGQRIGVHYGQAGASAGLGSVETVEAFLYFRFPVVKALMGMIEEEGLAAKRAARLFIEIGYYMDQVLVATMRAHEAATTKPRHPSGA
ncbi:MAG: helix-turn-helix domain-containing protein [Chloroflexota bacterium]|nr:helix-turn-helix domain-containing protein [Chloroflexota bacterium]